MKLKKVLFSLVIVVLLSSALFSCSGDLGDNWVPAGMQLASSTEADYKLYVPTSWVVDVSTGLTTAYCDSGNISFYSNRLEGTTISLSDYWKNYEKDLKASVPDLAYLTESDGMKLDSNIDALKYVYTGMVAGKAYKFMQVVCIKDVHAYIFTYTATAETYDNGLEDVNKILTNILFKE